MLSPTSFPAFVHDAFLQPEWEPVVVEAFGDPFEPAKAAIRMSFLADEDGKVLDTPELTPTYFRADVAEVVAFAAGKIELLAVEDGCGTWINFYREQKLPA